MNWKTMALVSASLLAAGLGVTSGSSVEPGVASVDASSSSVMEPTGIGLRTVATDDLRFLITVLPGSSASLRAESVSNVADAGARAMSWGGLVVTEGEPWPQQWFRLDSNATWSFVEVNDQGTEIAAGPEGNVVEGTPAVGIQPAPDFEGKTFNLGAGRHHAVFDSTRGIAVLNLTLTSQGPGVSVVETTESDDAIRWLSTFVPGDWDELTQVRVSTQGGFLNAHHAFEQQNAFGHIFMFTVTWKVDVELARPSGFNCIELWFLPPTVSYAGVINAEPGPYEVEVQMQAPMPGKNARAYMLIVDLPGIPPMGDSTCL